MCYNYGCCIKGINIYRSRVYEKSCYIVNGSKVIHTVIVKSEDSISLRFKVYNLSDTIKVGIYVVPMYRYIEFTVKLLENMLKFVKGYEV